jgi:hypothetical protein
MFKTVYPYDCDEIYDTQEFKLYDIEMGSFFYLSSNEGALNLISKNNYFRGSSLTVRGGIFNILPFENSTFYDENSTYEYNEALNGAVLYCEWCFSIIFVNCNFTNNRAQEGGVMALKSYSILYDSSNLYISNHAVRGAIVQCDRCQMYSDNSIFMNNTC